MKQVHSMKLRPERTVFLLVDVQERLASAMPAESWGEARRAFVALVEGAKVLQVPVVMTEQYPKGLGRTVEELAGRLPPDAAPIDKLAFSCVDAEPVMARLRQLGRDQIVVGGIECHVCVYQSARDLVQAGYQVHVLTDASLSRTEANRRLGLELMRQAGTVLSSSEVVLFDLLGQAGTPQFKAISALVK